MLPKNQCFMHFTSLKFGGLPQLQFLVYVAIHRNPQNDHVYALDAKERDSLHQNFCCKHIRPSASQWCEELLTQTSLCMYRVISRGSVMTPLRCVGKYDSDFIADFMENTTVKEFWKAANVCHSYERMYSGTIFFWLTVYYRSKAVCLCVLTRVTRIITATCRIIILRA